MKLNKVIGCAAAAMLVAGIFVTARAGDEKEEKITMEKVPSAVREAVKKYATEAEIKGIEEADADGKKVIEFDIEKNGKASEIAFRMDGALFSTEEEIALADCPEPVQKTIAKLSDGAKAGKPEIVVQEGKTSYEIVIKKDHHKIEYTISPEGKVTDKETIGTKEKDGENDKDEKKEKADKD